jgi:hypothetical protein
VGFMFYPWFSEIRGAVRQSKHRVSPRFNRAVLEIALEGGLG